MPWFKVDDSMAFSPKFVSLPLPAAGLWARAGSWAAQQLTDGFVPQGIVHAMCSGEQAPNVLCDALINAGLWLREDGGYRFHDWGDYQPTAESVREERRAAAERMRKVRAQRGQKSPSPADVRPNADRTNGERADEVREKFGDPDPTRPDPSVPSEQSEHEAPSSPRGRGKRATATRLPDDFVVTEEMKAWAAVEAPNANMRDHAQFVDFWAAKGGAAGRKLDWVATWRNWMRKASDDRDGGTSGRPRGSRPSGGPTPTERAADVARIAAELQAQADGRHLHAIGG